MTNEFQRVMQEATRLVRGGNLRAATAAIRAALAAGRAAQVPGRHVPADVGGADDLRVIDVDAREVPGRASAAQTAGHELRDGPAQSAGLHAGTYSGPCGTRTYKLFVPPDAVRRALPLIVMLHGCTQDPDDFAAGTAMNEAAAAQGFFVLYPAQAAKANPQRCWNWFKHNHQVRGRGEPAILAGMTREVIGHHGIDPERVYVAGLSAGGAMAAILAEAYPDIFAAAGIHSGLAAASAADLPSALAAMKGGRTTAARPPSGVPTIVFHGDADATVHSDNGGCVLAACVDERAVQERCETCTEGGRSSTRTVHLDASGHIIAEHWLVHGGGHAWFGGRAEGSYTDARGPDATGHMVRFFFSHRRRAEE